MKLADWGEFNLIDHIRQMTPLGDGVHRGIGDDASVLDLPYGFHLCTSTDMLIEGIHFNLEWVSFEDLGHKSIAVNLSDLAAMGAKPLYLYLSLACPASADVGQIEDFLSGALKEANKFNANLVGGDTCRSPGPWVISVTVEGCVPERCDIGRDGAKPDDLIMVSGTIGDSAMALAHLKNGQKPPVELFQRHARPTPRVELGQRLGDKKLASSMIDISDGLLGDLEHILQSSHVDGVIDISKIPLSDSFRGLAPHYADYHSLVLSGGEDYELLFTAAKSNAKEISNLGESLGIPITYIGQIQKGDGQIIVKDPTGKRRLFLNKGYDHFCPP